MKILIGLSTFNRPVITDIVLRNLSAFRSADVMLVVYDDCSTAYRDVDLIKFADQVVRFPSRGGIARSRARAMRDFVYRFSDFDLLYLTDNDSLHDPAAMGILRQGMAAQLSGDNRLPISLFRSVFHEEPTNILADQGDFMVAKSIPGNSRCYDRKMAGIIVDVLNQDPLLECSEGWDWHYITVLDRPCLMSRISYVEHFARDRAEPGLHGAWSGVGAIGLVDFERDRAINPTEWLKRARGVVLDKILF